MASVQELETKVAVLEDKVTFILKAFSVVSQGPFDVAPKQRSLEAVYLELKRQGVEQVSQEEADKLNSLAATRDGVII